MRTDINILWIDDTAVWQKTQQELFELKIDDLGLLTNIDYEDNADSLIQKIHSESIGFKTYDIIFVDYNISSTVLGDKVITELRSEDIDADILFYSANAANDIKEILMNEKELFDGIYIANRDNFQDKALALYKKNVKNMLSLSKVRGFLTDKTSENDYIINSYILNNFNRIPSAKQNEIIENIKENINTQIKQIDSNKSNYTSIVNNPNFNIKRLLSLPSYIVPLDLKYIIFNKILENLGDSTFNDKTIDDYLSKIVKKRNTVAHKKLDVCEQKKYIKHYDNIQQYNDNICPPDCDGTNCSINDNRKISLEEWEQISKLTNDYSKLFDKILNELEQNMQTPQEPAMT